MIVSRSVRRLLRIEFLVLSIEMAACSFSSTGSPSSIVSAAGAGETPKTKVVVVGGTHGNEYTGVWCIKALEQQLREESSSSSSSSSSPDSCPSSFTKKYPSLDVSTLLGNPQAYMANRRFLDEDLNRQFSYKALVAEPAENVESSRAQELNTILGPKRFNENDPPPVTDLLIDLHTTTANMGTSLIVELDDPVMVQAAAYVMAKYKQQYDGDDAQILLLTLPDPKVRPYLPSVASHSMSIEVGPIPQGVLRHDITEKTQRALELILEYEQRRQSEPDILSEEMERVYPAGTVPCIRSAPSKRLNELSGKIQWPSDPTNPNFPAWMIHKSVQDRDFHEIKTGDPLFVTLDGTVIPYDGSHGSPVILMFINEGGYYYSNSGTGIGVARRDLYSFKTGKLIEAEDDTNKSE